MDMLPCLLTTTRGELHVWEERLQAPALLHRPPVGLFFAGCSLSGAGGWEGSEGPGTQEGRIPTSPLFTVAVCLWVQAQVQRQVESACK